MRVAALVKPGKEKADMQSTRDSGRNLAHLGEVLREMFQLDRGDLDFGLYRIMRMKANEIEGFLDRDLLPQVKTIIAGVTDEQRTAIEAELDRAIRSARELGVDPGDAPVVAKLREQLAEAKADVTAETDVYGHLANFFERYYSDGDFMSLRRYSAGGEPIYLVPYHGEEVKLHWANADQYYVKTTENYASYAFLAGDGDARFRTRFEIVVADSERDNIKETNGRQRRFVLAEDAVTVGEVGLVVRFEHRPLTEREKRAWRGNGARQQDRINADMVARILAALEKLAPERRSVLAALAPTDANPERTLLSKHVGRYTAKNSFDYFIHKDLGGFLRRELDFYIKTEVLDLQDLALGDTARLRRALSRMRAVREIGDKLIAFLAQLEDFQKRLWLKKKFVLETQWCVTLDRVPEAFYPEIVANRGQQAEWQALFSIGGNADGLETKENTALPGFFEASGGFPPDHGGNMALSPVFLRENPYLVLDTAHFDHDFRDRLLAALSEDGPLDERTDGVLVHGENFQALNLLQTRYAEQVRLVYIDPPYNTGSDGFVYKDGYRSSSWLSAMLDRIRISRLLLMPAGQFAAHIDENEYENLHRLLLEVFGADYLGSVIWNKRNPKGDSRGLAVQHESILWAVRDAGKLSSEEIQLKRPKRHAKSIVETAARFVRSSGSIDEARGKFSAWIRKQKCSQGELAYNQIDDDGRVYSSVSMAWPKRSTAPKEYFHPLVHPVTGKPCPIPERGWRNTAGTMENLLDQGLIIFGPDETTQPRRKYFLEENMLENISSVFDHGGSSDPEARSLGMEFETMKPLPVAKYACNFGNDGIVLDFFAGSGTTAHAVVDLNREDGGKRKYILVEMGQHFDTVMLPRLKKVVHSPNWKDGKPTSRDGGVSQLVRYIRLESYEDTLDGLIVTPPSKDLLAESGTALVEDYRLRYALNEETTDSPCLLGGTFRNPFDYTLSVVRDGTRREVSVDLPETFNLLLGMRVESRRRLGDVFAITGRDAKGQSCLILWRNLDETGNEALNGWLRRNLTDMPSKLDLIYANGDHTLNAVRRKGDNWEAVIIEPLFRELMFKA